MFEWNDVGIKDSDDLIEALTKRPDRRPTEARDLWDVDVNGRVRPMFPDALDTMMMRRDQWANRALLATLQRDNLRKALIDLLNAVHALPVVAGHDTRLGVAITEAYSTLRNVEEQL